VAGHVFISYSRIDRPYVDQLAAFLTTEGIPVWYDYRLAAGETFDATIETQIDTCAAFVVVLTPHSVQSKWVGLEIGRADDEDRAILPLLLEPCKAPIRLQNSHRESVIGGLMPPAAFVVRLRELAVTSAPPPLTPHAASTEVSTISQPASTAPWPPYHRLVVTAGALKGTSLRLGNNPITIGRSQDSTLVLSDEYASAHHARLTLRVSGWYIEDLGSINGTYLDGELVTRPDLVVPGQQIRIGETCFELQ
jgi:hypothetical protein